MRHTRLYCVVLFATAFTALWPSAADACSCKAPGPPCAAYWRADAVFVGRVTSIEPAASETGAGAELRVHFAVQRVHRGGDAGQLTIHTPTSEAGCGYPFRAGETYVVYAQKSPKGTLMASLCSRTRRAADAAEDAKYAQEVSNIAPGFRSRIAGRISAWGWSGAESPAGMFAGVKVTATAGDLQFAATSNAAGEFTIKDVPPGRYSVVAEAPAGYLATPRQVDLNDPQGCGPTDLAFSYDGRVAGRVVDSKGAPLGGLPIDLVVSAERDVRGGSYKRISGWTGADGTFELQRVPRGEYVLGFNSMRDHTGAVVLPRAFHPGVVDPNAAATIKVDAGERVQLLDFVVPPEIAFTTVQGIVVDLDGRPVKDATLTLRDNTEGPNIIGQDFKTKEDGRFSFSVVADLRYNLHVSVRDEKHPTGPPLVCIKYFTASAGLPMMTIVLKPSKH